MQFSISREALLTPLQLVTGVVERRHTLPILSNVLMELKDNVLSLTGTDTELELSGRVAVDSMEEAGQITVPALKILEICRALGQEASIKFLLDENKLIITSGRSKYTLITLPAADYPLVEEAIDSFQLNIEQGELLNLLETTSFAMAVNDVRYYLNGLLLEVAPDHVRTVATDGHRLAQNTLKMENPVEELKHFILPRKAVEQLMKLIQEGYENLALTFGHNHLRIRVADFTFTTKLVDGKYPNYDRVIPKDGHRIVVGHCEYLKQAFSRASILTNEKFFGVRVSLSENQMKISANNPEQEEAIEIVEVKYTHDPMEIGFNVKYLISVLSTVTTREVKMILSDPDSSALLEEEQDSEEEQGDEEGQAGNALYVIMPMRL